METCESLKQCIVTLTHSLEQAIDHGAQAYQKIEALQSTLAERESEIVRLKEVDQGEISDGWLLLEGFQMRSLYWSKLLPPVDGGAIVELCLQPPLENVVNPTWSVGLLQGLPDGDDQEFPDDYVLLTSIYPKTRGEVKRILAALTPPEQESAER